MSAGDLSTLSLEDKLFTVRRKVAGESHIKVETSLCRECSSRVCTYICPAGVFVWNEAESTVEVRYEDCLECGTCRIACEMGAIEWSNPPWGSGVSYKHS